MKIKTLKTLFFVLLLSIPFVGNAAEFSKVQFDKSNITFVSRQMGVSVEGLFKKFAAKVRINPAKVESGSAQIEIDVASIDAGSMEANDEVKGKTWFDVTTYPQASFVSGSVESLGGGKYEASGKMTIKGKSVDLRAPFVMKEDKGALNVDGAITLKRLEFGIGSGLWSDTSVVADEVQIKFHLVLK